MKTEDTEVLGRELNQPRSKPDTVDQPVRTARIFVNHYNSTQYCKTETVFSIFPVLQTNITSQMCPLKMLKLDLFPNRLSGVDCGGNCPWVT